MSIIMINGMPSIVPIMHMIMLIIIHIIKILCI